MKSLEDQMGFYAAYHQDARNKATHFVGVPAIMLALFIPLTWLQVNVAGYVVTGTLVLATVVILYYAFLDPLLAFMAALVTGLLITAGEWLSLQGSLIAWISFAVLFIGGWILQLVGHAFEGRKPALADNLFQIFIAPIFLCAELFFALGYNPKLHAAVQERALRMRKQ